MKNTKWWLGCMVALAGAGMAAGTEITLEQAETAVGNWLARGGAFGVLASNAEVSGETYEDTDTGARMHVVRIPGKGFAVTSTDDGIEPIIFFSDGDSDAGFIPEEGNPMWDLLRWDLAARMMEQERNVDGKIARITAKDGEGTTQKKWKDLLETDMQVARRNATKATVNTKSSISDIRRDRILGTKWGQREVKLGATLHPAYNFYTPPDAPPVAKAIARNSPPTKDLQPDETNEANPVHYPCGCVATAGGQLMRKWGYPAAPKERKTVGCSLDGKSIQLTMQGGPYRWGNMGEKVPATPAQCEAVGRVLYDIGVACGASYEDAEHGGTGMQTADLVKNLRTVFGYKSATYFGTAFYESEGSVLDRLKKIAIPNLDAKAPILLDIKRARFNEKINHAVVADGYGYDNGNFSLHVNFGWNGKGNGWYVPPSFHPDPEYDYDFIRGVAGNIFPNKEGVVASGRAEGAHGRPVSGVEVRLCTPSGDVLQAKTTGIDGVYWFMEEPGTYVVQVGVGSTTTEGSLVLTECGDDAIGNAIQDWMLPSVLTVADISKVPETVSPAARGAEDSTVFAPFEVRLTNSTPGAEIRYTLDGTQPTPESDFYEEPIPIQDTTTLRAVGYADGMECSEEFTKTWIFEDPSNRDQFADARPLLGSSSRATFSNTGYTKEPEEPLHSSDGFAGGASVWATWTAPADGDWTFWLEGTSDSEDSDELDTQLAVYTGASVGELVRVSSNDDTPAGGTSSRVSIHAEKGVEYKIARDTRGGGGGTLTLRWEEGYIH